MITYRQSIRSKLIFASVSVVTLVLAIVSGIVIFGINGIVDSFLNLSKQRSHAAILSMQENSERTKQKITGFLSKSLRDKGYNLVQKDHLTISPAFLDNEFSKIEVFLQKTFENDADIIHASLFTVEDGDIRTWAYFSQQFPEGLELGTAYNKEKKAWIASKDYQIIEIKDSRVDKILESTGANIRAVDHLLVEPSGTARVVKAFESWIPVHDEEEMMDEAGAVRGYLRYIINLEGMQLAIQQEESVLETLLEKQKKGSLRFYNETNELGESTVQDAVLLLYLSSLALFLLVIGIYSYISYRITKPLQDLDKAAREIASGDYDQVIQVGSKDEIGKLAESFDQMRLKVRIFTNDLQNMVDRKTHDLQVALFDANDKKRRIQEILLNIKQGIFTFGEEFTIDSEYSRHLGEIFDDPETDISGQDVFEFLFTNSTLDGDQVETIRSSLEGSIGFTLINWKINQYHLPKELRLQHAAGSSEVKILGVDWYPAVIKLDSDDGIVEDQNAIVNKVMVTIRDLTHEKALEEKVRKEQEKAESLVRRVTEMLSKPNEKISDFFDAAFYKIAEVKRLAKSDPAKHYHDIYRELHNLKGISRSVGLSRISLATHNAETELEKLKGEGDTKDNRESFHNSLIQLEKELKEYKAVALQLPSHKKSGSTHFSLYEAISESIGAAVDLLRKNNYTLENLSCQDQVFSWNAVHHDAISTIILHCFTNSIVHGYFSDEKAESSDVRLAVESHRNDDKVILKIQDEGKGFDAEKILHTAKAKGIDTTRMENPLDLLMIDGFSTQESATIEAGRGVGLPAVRALVEEIGGVIQLGPGDRRGASIVIELPDSVIHDKDKDLETAG